MGKNKRMQIGFTLMEMMAVLLIVSVIAAAAAPIIKDKLVQNTGNSSFSQVRATSDQQSEIAELKARLLIYEKQLNEFEMRLHKLEMWSSKE